jgi:hypothetical protein
LKSVEARPEPHQDEGDGPAESSGDESENSNAGAAPGDDATNDATPEGADATNTDSDNDGDPRDLEGLDAQAMAMGATFEAGGATWKRVEKMLGECATCQGKNPQQMKSR